MWWTLTKVCEERVRSTPLWDVSHAVHPMHSYILDALAVAAYARHAHFAVASPPGCELSPRRSLPARPFYTPRGGGRHHRALAGAHRSRTARPVRRPLGPRERAGSQRHVHLRRAQARRFEPWHDGRRSSGTT